MEPQRRWLHAAGALLGIVAELINQPPRYVAHTFGLKGFADAKEIWVAGSFNGWAQQANRLVRRGDAWVGEAELEPGRIAYKFVVDGQWLIDPANDRTEGKGQYQNSVLQVAER